MSKTIEITRVEDVREGDVVTISRFGVTITGRIEGEIRYRGGQGNVIRDVQIGESSQFSLGTGLWEFVKATREAPDLPTEPGSVIVNATIRGTEGVTAFLSASAWEPDVYRWISGDRIEGAREHDRANITAWTPARIVPATETTTEVPNRCGGCWDLGPHNYGPGCDYRGLV